MSKCPCYHDEENWLHERGVCWGTKEREPCSCGGDELKCNFYEEVRNTAKREKEQADSKGLRGEFQSYQFVEDGTYVVKDGVLYKLVPKVTYYPGAALFNVLTGETHYQTNYARVVNMSPKELAEFIEADRNKPWCTPAGYPCKYLQDDDFAHYGRCELCALEWMNKEENHDD